MSEIVVTQQLIREIATRVIRKLLQGPMAGSGDVIGTCRDHPIFTQLPMEGRDNLIDAVFTATETAHITISWNDTVIAVVGASDTLRGPRDGAPDAPCGAPVPGEMTLLAIGGCLEPAGHERHRWPFRRDEETPPPGFVESKLQLPQVWCDRYGLEVRDPDGWRRDALPLTVPISLPDFWKRYGASTARIPTPEQYERIRADVNAAKEASG